MVQTEDSELDNMGSQVKICDIMRASGSCGFNLTKSKWDPYPWVNNVECGSPADVAGVQAGDCLLEVNGEDVLGLKVVEVADKVKARDERVTVMLWNSGANLHCTPETLCCGPMPTNLQRLSSCMNNILAALECPVCLDTISPPAHQCANGHLLCFRCRVKTDKCPVCRLKLFRGRSLLADQVYNSLIDAFNLRNTEESRKQKMLKEKILGHKSGSKTKPEIKINFLNAPTNKILSRLFRHGKSSSAENLTSSNELRQIKNSIKVQDLGLKTKSLSSNEIFILDNQQTSRTLSNRPGSGLLDVKNVQYFKRPASYHGSVEDLQKRLIGDFECFEYICPTNQQCYCPCDINCKEKINVNNLFKHIQENHEGPLLHLFKPELKITLPLVYESKTIIVITFCETFFIVKFADNSCTTKNNYLWVWSVKSKQDFTVSVTVEENGLTKTFECPVALIETTGWEDIEKNYSVPLSLTKGTLKLFIKPS